MTDFIGFGDWIEIFRGGPQIDSTGKEHNGDALIDSALQKFNPAEHEPPLVVGHPTENGPALGWVEGLRKSVQDGVAILEAKIKQVVPEFADLVQQGLYKKRSAAFYQDGSLRHVGFLGAMPPAIKGLKDLTFREKGVHFSYTWHFAEGAPDSVGATHASPGFADAAQSPEQQAQVARATKYNIAVKDGGHLTKPGQWTDVEDSAWLDPVNYRYPCPDAAQTRAAAAYWGKPANQEQYSQAERALISERLAAREKKFGIGGSTHMEEKQFTLADLQAAEAKVRAQLAAEFAEREKRLKRGQELMARLDKLVTDGKVPPAIIDATFKEFVQAIDLGPVLEFCEGKPSPAEFLLGKLEGMAKLGLFSEIATKDKVGAEFTEAQKLEALGLSIAAKAQPQTK